MEANEDYDEAADRELDEELGVAAQLDRIGKLPASEKTGQEFIVVYRGEHNGPFSFPSEEISAVEFFPVDIVERWVQISRKILRQDFWNAGVCSKPNPAQQGAVVSSASPARTYRPP